MPEIPIPDGPEEIVFKGKIIAVVHQPMKIGEKSRTFEVARRSPGTRSIIISPEGKILLTREYRHDIGEDDYRLPGGKVCDTLDEYLQLTKDPATIEEVARRGAINEVREEAGIAVKDLKLFTIAPSGGPTIGWDLYYFVVTNFTTLLDQHLGEGERIQTGWYSVPEAIDICLSGKMKEARTVGVLLRYFHSIGKI